MHSYIISDAFVHNFRCFLRLDPMPQLLSGTYRQDLHIFILNYRSGGNNTEYQTVLIYASNRTYLTSNTEFQVFMPSIPIIFCANASEKFEFLKETT